MPGSLQGDNEANQSVADSQSQQKSQREKAQRKHQAAKKNN